jgi:hypothetical protein
MLPFLFFQFPALLATVPPPHGEGFRNFLAEQVRTLVTLQPPAASSLVGGVATSDCVIYILDF